MAVQAAQIAAAKTASPAPTAPVKSGAGAVFAALLAKLNPANTSSLSSRPSDASASREPGPIAQQVGSIPDRRAARSVRDDNGDNVTTPALVTLQPVMSPPVAAPVTPQAASDLAAKNGKGFADLKAIDPAQLKAALTQPTTPMKPGTPTLPVMPMAGDDEGEDDTASAKDIAAKFAPGASDAAQAVTTIAQHLMKPATPVQTTEAQATPVKFDAKPDTQNSGTNSDSGSKDGQQDRPHTPANTAAPVQQAATHAPAAQAAAPIAEAKVAETTATAPAATGAVSQIQQAQPAQATSATLHVAAQASQSAPQQPDIAALAVNIAAKAQAGTKHFDIRLDPPELGRIEVHLSVDDSGKAQAHLAADRPQTLDLLQRDSGTLQKALKESGIDLGNTGLQFSLRGQDREAGNAPKPFPRGRALAVSAVADASPISTNHVASDSARLDIRV